MGNVRRAGSSRLVRLKLQGPDPDRGPGPPGTTKIYKVGLESIFAPISRVEICGLLMMNVSMPCLSWLLKTT